MGPFPQTRISSILVSLLGSAPPLTFSKSADGPGFLKGVLTKRDTNLDLILFLGQGPKIYKAKTRSCTKVA